MSYAGNPSLSSDVQGRILDTFRHTLDVAGRGDVEEARLGCDFILRLDPLFSPAQALADRLRDASGPVAVSDLRSRLDGDGDGALPDMGELPELPLEDVAAGDLAAELAGMVAARDFTGLMIRAQGAQAEIAADPALQRLMAEAQERMEAAPYVDKFLEKARGGFAAGRTDEARSALEKARALDPTHPGVTALSEQLAGGAATAAAVAAPGSAFAAAAASPAAAAVEPTPGGGFPGHGQTGFGETSSETSSGQPSFGAGSFGETSFGQTSVGGTSFGETSFGDDALASSPSGMELGAEMPLDLPPLDLPDLDGAPAPALSFDTLAGVGGPTAPAGGGAEAAAAAASDPDPRIAELLDEGQALFSRSEHQGAIDAWSRIFLIDIDHQEAARRIDLARNAKAEQERQLEETYHDALAKVQAGDLAAARTGLEEVVRLQPHHLGAREVLEKLDRGQLDDLPRPPAAAAAGAGAADPLAGFGDGDGEAVLSEEILVPPEPGSVRRPAAAPVAAKPPDSRRKLLLAAAAVVVLALVAGFFLRSRWSSLFPNTAEEPVRSAREGSEQTPITRATELAREGNRAMAIAQLKRVPPPSPFYDEAQALITQWEAEEAAAAGEGAPLAPDQAARQEELLALARQAHAEGRHLAVEPLLQQAATIAALPPDVQAIREESAANLQPLQDALTLLRSEEYERSLRMLWEAHEADPTNPDVRHLLVSAYHNMGVLSLQQGKPEEAGEHFQEALELAPGDAELQRLQQLARTYRDRAPDLLYRIYTKYLTPRKL